MLEIYSTNSALANRWYKDGVGVYKNRQNTPTKSHKHSQKQKGGIQVKCPYNGFKDCIVQECPSCNYETREHTRIVGRYTGSLQEALERGAAWEEKYVEYKFISCKLADGGVQPVPPKTETINNTQKTNVVIHKSIF